MSNTPYLGSRISLISKNDVRYEGILYAIDSNQSEVYLQNVRCFGTEDRNKENSVPPTVDVYGCIIFHGSDIKDLHVMDDSPMMNYQGGPGGYRGYPPNYPMMTQYGQYYGNPYPQYNPYGYGFEPGMTDQNYMGQYAGQPGFDPSQVDMNNDYSNLNKEAALESENEAQPVQSKENQAIESSAPVEKKSESTSAPISSQSPVSQPPTQVPTSQSNSPAIQSSGSTQTPALATKSSTTKESSQQQRKPQTQKKLQTKDNKPQEKSRTNANDSSNKQHSRRGGRGKNSFSRNRGQRELTGQFTGPANSQKASFEEEFDFESGFAKFDKEALKSELLGEGDDDNLEEPVAYERSGFFDTISCDSLDREIGEKRDHRQTLQQQRKLDTETFGPQYVAANEKNRYRNRRRNQNQNQRNYSRHKGNTQNNNKGPQNNQVNQPRKRQDRVSSNNS